MYSTITHKNGGLEQGILEAVKETQGLTAADQKRLDDLKSLPQDRTEVTRKSKLKIKAATPKK